jgi:hypothetical protein
MFDFSRCRAQGSESTRSCGFPLIVAVGARVAPCWTGTPDSPGTRWGLIEREVRGQADAALVTRFRQAVARRDRAAAFDRLVRVHRDAVLGRCTERLWPDADAAVAAARDVFVAGYLAMADPAKLARPDLLQDWLLGIASYGELGSLLPAGIDGINWGALQAGIAADALDNPDTRDSAARRASLRRWLEQIVATLPEARQQMYDLFVRRAVGSQNAATELGTDATEARRLRRENRDAVLRAFGVTALAVTEAGRDPLGGEALGCSQLRHMLTGAQGAGGTDEGVGPDAVVLPADLRLAVTRHVGQCDACRDRRDDCIAQWAPELLPILAGAELNEQVIEDLRTIPAAGRPQRPQRPQRPHVGVTAHGGPGSRRGARLPGAQGGTGKALLARRAAAAGAGLLALLLMLGFVQPGFFLSSAASAPRVSSSSSPKDPGSGNPQMIGTSAEVRGRSAHSAAKGSPGGSPPVAGVTSTEATSPFDSPTQPGQGTPQPSSSSRSPSAQPTTASPGSSPTPSPSASAGQPSPVRSTTPPSSPAPTTSPPTTPASATPTSTPSTSAPPT